MNPSGIACIKVAVVGTSAGLGDFAVVASVSVIIGRVGISDGVDDGKFVDSNINPSGKRTTVTTNCVSLAIPQCRKLGIKIESPHQQLY